MKLKYRIPTSLSHTPIKIIVQIALIAFFIAFLTTTAQATNTLLGVVPTYSNFEGAGWATTPSPSEAAKTTDYNLGTSDCCNGKITGTDGVWTSGNVTWDTGGLNYTSVIDIKLTYSFEWWLSTSVDGTNYIVDYESSGSYNGGRSIYKNIRYVRLTYRYLGTGDVYPMTYEIYTTAYASTVTLYTPINGSVTNKSYPPLTTDVNFTWSDPGVYANLMIAKDNAFNLIIVDSGISTNQSNQSLEAGTYYWKVRYYEPLTNVYYAWSVTSNFTLSDTQVTSGTAIQGVITDSQTLQPIDKASVIISNTSWTSTMIVGSNGYYLFSSLNNNTLYSLKATAKDYNDGDIELVTPTYNQWSTKNLILKLCVSGLTCFYNQEYQTVIVSHVNGTEYPDVTVTIYKENEVVATDSKNTDTFGYVKFLVIKDTKYRVVVGSDTKYFYSSGNAPWLFVIGELSYTIPSATPYSNRSTYTVNYTNRSSSFQNFTSSYLTSSVGLGSMGQGILAGLVNWIVVGSGGWLATIFVAGILAYLEIITWVTLLFFTITAISLYVLTRM